MLLFKTRMKPGQDFGILSKVAKIFLPSIVLQVPFIDIFYHIWALRGVTYVNAHIWALMIIDVYLEPCMTN